MHFESVLMLEAQQAQGYLDYRNVVKSPSLADFEPAQYNATYGSKTNLESHAGDGPQRWQKRREKGGQNAGGSADS
jgi:hypothetical protein